LDRGELTSLQLLDSHKDSFQWRANTWAYDDFVYVGVERSVMPDAATLLRTAFGLAQSVPEVAYGIGYYRELSKGPHWYAGGVIYGVPHGDPERERIAEWGREMIGRQRYHCGWFRGAYPASLLSREHHLAAEGTGLGVLTQVSENHWLWALSDPEIPHAEAELERAGRLILPVTRGPAIRVVTRDQGLGGVAAGQQGATLVGQALAGTTVHLGEEQTYDSQLQYYWSHPPRCLADFTSERAELKDPRLDGHPGELDTVFRLSCPCGEPGQHVLGDCVEKGGDASAWTADWGRLGLRCSLCGRAAEVFDVRQHGHDAEMVRDRFPLDRDLEGERCTFACPGCGGSRLLTHARFENSCDLLDSQTDKWRGKEQDLFTWFTLIGQCLACGEFAIVYDLECA